MSADLVVFGEDWGGLPSSTQHLVRELSSSRRVVWVNSIGMRRPRLQLRDLTRAWRKLTAMAHAPVKSTANDPIDVLNPRALPLPGNPFARGVNRLLLGSTVRKRLQARRIDKPVLWLSLPTAVDVVGELGERAVVYYCGDDFGALEGVDHAPVLAMESELANRADLVLVSHPALIAKFPAEKVHYIPHGVDLRRFASAPVIETGTHKPVAGFVGSIDSRLDLIALANAARLLPDWEFRLYGPVKTDLRVLRDVPNISTRGPLAPSQVPGMIKGWRVALLPYVDCPMVRACNPLKLREYLATGVPIAAISMPALAEFNDAVSTSDPSGLAQAILQASSYDSEASRLWRISRVTDQTWTTQAERVAQLIDSL